MKAETRNRLRLLGAHKALYIVTLAVMLLITESVYYFIQAAPTSEKLTVCFVDTAGATLGSYDRICAQFGDNTHAAFVSRQNTDAFALPGNEGQALEDELVRQGADVLILRDDDLALLAAKGRLARLDRTPLTPQEEGLTCIDGICYGILIDGIDLTGMGDAFWGYKDGTAENNRYICAAVLEKADGRDEALAALADFAARLSLREENGSK